MMWNVFTVTGAISSLDRSARALILLRNLSSLSLYSHLPTNCGKITFSVVSVCHPVCPSNLLNLDLTVREPCPDIYKLAPYEARTVGKCRSYTAEFEFLSWVSPRVTADLLVCSSWSCFLYLFTYIYTKFLEGTKAIGDK